MPTKLTSRPSASVHAHNWAGRYRQQYRSIFVQKSADAKHVGYMLVMLFWVNRVKVVTYICESTIPTINSKLLHSACPCKNYAPKCSRKPQELIVFSRYLVCNVCSIFIQNSYHGGCKKHGNLNIVEGKPMQSKKSMILSCEFRLGGGKSHHLYKTLIWQFGCMCTTHSIGPEKKNNDNLNHNQYSQE